MVSVGIEEGGGGGEFLANSGEFNSIDSEVWLFVGPGQRFTITGLWHLIDVNAGYKPVH